MPPTADQLGAMRDQPEVVTGVHLMQGIGHRPARGFWAEAWSQVVRRPTAIFGLTWIGIIAFFACFAPLLASGHPLVWRPAGEPGPATSPLLSHLTAMDWVLMIGGVVGSVYVFGPWGGKRSSKLGVTIGAGVQAGVTVIAKLIVESKFSARDADQWMRDLEQWPLFNWAAAAVIAVVVALPFLYLNPIDRFLRRAAVVAAIAATLAVILGWTWSTPLTQFEYRGAVARGEAGALYTAVPFSPQEGDTTRKLKAPGSSLYKPAIDDFVRIVARQHPTAKFADDPRWEVAGLSDPNTTLAEIPMTPDLVDAAASMLERPGAVLPEPAADVTARLRQAHAEGSLATVADAVAFLRDQPSPRFVLGTDSLGQDVFSQMLHACRLSISIGLVSTGIAVVIGVTIGALMGYFGGWVDLVLYRVVEVFMSIPTLFLLIVAAAVLPRNTYVMMAIIGCVTWTGAARFIRAEFYKLRGQDFVQSARAVGLPLRSILFKHMLPNGVTPVLVEASFAIAAAILIEATLSYLGLGPANQASWGRLLSDATNQVGDFVWWLAIFPGLAIFLTVLSYNFVGEALRDAIDPKLKKARV